MVAFQGCITFPSLLCCHFSETDFETAIAFTRTGHQSITKLGNPAKRHTGRRCLQIMAYSLRSPKLPGVQALAIGPALLPIASHGECLPGWYWRRRPMNGDWRQPARFLSSSRCPLVEDRAEPPFCPQESPMPLGRHLEGNLQKPNLGEVSFCHTLYSSSGTEGLSTLGATPSISLSSPGCFVNVEALPHCAGCTAGDPIFC